MAALRNALSVIFKLQHKSYFKEAWYLDWLHLFTLSVYGSSCNVVTAPHKVLLAVTTKMHDIIVFTNHGFDQNAAHPPELCSGSDGFAALEPLLALSAAGLSVLEPNIEPKPDPNAPIVLLMMPASTYTDPHNDSTT